MRQPEDGKRAQQVHVTGEVVELREDERRADGLDER
jgi:hypothetical protein